MDRLEISRWGIEQQYRAAYAANNYHDDDEDKGYTSASLIIIKIALMAPIALVTLMTPIALVTLTSIMMIISAMMIVKMANNWQNS